MKRALKLCLVLAVLAAAVEGGAHLVRAARADGGAENGSGGAGERRVPVLTAEIREMEFVRGVTVVGDVAAINYAIVSARVPGILDEVLVDEGDFVVATETVLFRTDSMNLTNAVDLARHEMAVAECSVREARANRKRLEASQGQVLKDLERYRRLKADGAATARQLEVMETQAREVAATLEHAEAVIDLAAARQRQAASRLAIAEKNRADSAVTAPISGQVTSRLREPGEMAAAGTPILHIENLEALEFSALLPEETYAEVRPGETEVRAHLGGAALDPLKVTFRGPKVHPTLRNFEVKVEIPTPVAGLVPGRLVNMTVVLEKRRGMGVPRSAVVRRGGEAIVFIAVGDRAKAVPVVLGLPTDGYVEATGEGLGPRARIVVEGQTWLADGTPIVLVKED